MKRVFFISHTEQQELKVQKVYKYLFIYKIIFFFTVMTNILFFRRMFHSLVKTAWELYYHLGLDYNKYILALHSVFKH